MPQIKDLDWDRMLNEAYVFLCKHDTGIKPSARKERGKCKQAHKKHLCRHCKRRAAAVVAGDAIAAADDGAPQAADVAVEKVIAAFNKVDMNGTTNKNNN